MFQKLEDVNETISLRQLLMESVDEKLKVGAQQFFSNPHLNLCSQARINKT